MTESRDLAVLAVYFNPGGYRSTVANFHRFYERLQIQGVRVHALELAFGDDPFYLADLDGVMRLRTDDVLWQLERMVNHLIVSLPAHFTKVAWLDTDILFENDAWYDHTSRALDQFPVVQPFQTAAWLDHNGRVARRAPGIVAASRLYPDLFQRPIEVHPGFAWAARRELLQRHGIPDFCILGGGDRVLANAVYDIVWPREMAHYSAALKRRIRQWSRAFHADVRHQAGWIESTVQHIWHGKLADRRYLTRNIPLIEEEFDPINDIRIGQDGAWHWATDKPKLHAAIKGYFASLNADSSAR